MWLLGVGGEGCGYWVWVCGCGSDAASGLQYVWVCTHQLTQHSSVHTCTAGKAWLQQVMATEQLSDNLVIAGLYQLG